MVLTLEKQDSKPISAQTVIANLIGDTQEVVPHIVVEPATEATLTKRSTAIIPKMLDTSAANNSKQAKHPGAKALTTIISIIICLGLLAPLTLTCGRGASVNSLVKGNMRTVQIAAESFATDNGGIYPISVKQLSPYLPGGSLEIGGNQGTIPANPINAADKGLVDGPVLLTSQAIAELRELRISKSTLKPGQVAYCAVGNGESYAVTGVSSNGMQTSGVGGRVLVFSNQ